MNSVFPSKEREAKGESERACEREKDIARKVGKKEREQKGHK